MREEEPHATRRPTANHYGGANGIGAGCVRRLAKEGANVAIADIDDAAGKALAADLGEAVIYVRCDVANRAPVEALFDEVLSAFGAVDILVNNAAFVHKPGVIANFLEYSDASWRKTLDVNLTGMFHCSQTAARLMAKRGQGGVIINMSSGGRLARPSAHVGLREPAGRHRGGNAGRWLSIWPVEHTGERGRAGQHARRPRHIGR